MDADLFTNTHSAASHEYWFRAAVGGSPELPLLRVSLLSVVWLWQAACGHHCLFVLAGLSMPSALISAIGSVLLAITGVLSERRSRTSQTRASEARLLIWGCSAGMPHAFWCRQRVGHRK